MWRTAASAAGRSTGDKPRSHRGQRGMRERPQARPTAIRTSRLPNGPGPRLAARAVAAETSGTEEELMATGLTRAPSRLAAVRDAGATQLLVPSWDGSLRRMAS